MTWVELLADKRVKAEPPSKPELDNLRSIVTRSLTDVAAPGLSADTRFVLAYDAARTLSLIVVRAEGYRPRAVGGHYNTFLALEAAEAVFARPVGLLRRVPDEAERLRVRLRRRRDRHRRGGVAPGGPAVRRRCRSVGDGAAPTPGVTPCPSPPPTSPGSSA